MHVRVPTTLPVAVITALEKSCAALRFCFWCKTRQTHHGVN